jgi:hypothetical protein
MNSITEDTPIVSIVLVVYSSSSTNYLPRRISTAAVSSLAETIISTIMHQHTRRI